MKHFICVMIITFMAVSAHAADVGVSISVGQPGFYGRIDIGNFFQPKLIYPKPIIIGTPPLHIAATPVYLHIPPGHAKHWDKHCAEYNACGRPVYFVTDQWYIDVFVPQYQARVERHGTVGKGRDKQNNGNHGHGKGKSR